MNIKSPEIKTFKQDLDAIVDLVMNFKATSSADLKIQSLLNVTVYVTATRFLEGAIKHIIYNCCAIRGDSKVRLKKTVEKLRGFNNPEFKNIKKIIEVNMKYDIINGKIKGKFDDKDIASLNQIVLNRHKNVHAPEDPGQWYGVNRKDVTDFKKEYVGLIKILVFLDSICWNSRTKSFKP